MVRITFVQPDGTRREVMGEPGSSVMQTALEQGVDGISAECNGSAACATCHAYFETERLGRLDTMQEHEDDMLGLCRQRTPRGEPAELPGQGERGARRRGDRPAGHAVAVQSNVRTGSPRISNFGAMPRPGLSGAVMRPFTRCGAPSAIATVP